jgi:hypothetical protein
VVHILASWVLPFVMVVGGLFVTCKLVPRNRATWKTALVGALLAAVALLATWASSPAPSSCSAPSWWPRSIATACRMG